MLVMSADMEVEAKEDKDVWGWHVVNVLSSTLRLCTVCLQDVEPLVRSLLLEKSNEN